jgi:hypothetical protein
MATRVSSVSGRQPKLAIALNQLASTKRWAPFQGGAGTFLLIFRHYYTQKYPLNAR